MITTQKITYQQDGSTFEGFYAVDDQLSGKRPGVLIAHDWTGRNDFAEDKAKKLAALGYVGFALDMYGNGKCGETKEEKMGLIQPMFNDRSLLRARMLAALETMKKIELVDKTKLGAIGFCFGGLCVLDLARSGAEVNGVVSFHGLLNPPDGNLPNQPIKAKVLVLHGYDDPMVTPDQVISFAREMTEAKVDWQIDMYGNTLHGFTNPLANDPALGTKYSPMMEKRSWIAMKNFFNEIF